LSQFELSHHSKNQLDRRELHSDTNEPSDCDEQKFVDRLVQGDGTAWRSFVTDYGSVVRWRVADVAATFGRSSDNNSIDDAVAEVFAALLSNDAAALRGFEGRSSLRTYLAVIATRSATRVFSRITGFVQPNFDQLDDANEHPATASSPCSDASNPLANLIQSEDRSRLKQLLARLPNRQQSIIEMYYLDGSSYSEISDALNIPIGSIGVTLRRAESKLRTWYTDNLDQAAEVPNKRPT
jgi:RNA polymerase sigma-70 factor (ECF subfamily)